MRNLDMRNFIMRITIGTFFGVPCFIDSLSGTRSVATQRSAKISYVADWLRVGQSSKKL